MKIREKFSSLVYAFPKIVLFTTSYIPLIVIIIFQLLGPFVEINKEFILNKNFWIQLYYYEFFGWLIFFVGVILILLYVLGRILKNTPDENLQNEIEIEDVNNLNAYSITNYFSVYIFPFITLNFVSFSGVATLIILVILIGYIYIKNDILYINPILNIFFGFNIYSILIKEEDKIKEIMILSKKSRASLRVNPKITIQKIGYSVFIEY